MKWQTPPESKRNGSGPTTFKSEAADLKARPGEWALITETGYSSAANGVKTARIKAFAPAGSFEATGRNRPDGKFDVYARYIGEVSA